jgi:hypothetical protein
MSTRTFTSIEFLENLLIPDLKKMIDNELHYYAFSIICQGVELLGAAKDEQKFEKSSESESRFTWALKELFADGRYRNNQSKFFSFLRGPLVHQLRPGDGFLIASIKKDKIDPKMHLERHESGALVLVIEPFLDDFCCAVERLKKLVSGNKIPAANRFTAGFIEVSDMPLSYGQKSWNANLRDMVTFTATATGSANPGVANQGNSSSVD